MAETQVLDVRDAIIDNLKEDERTLSWLARQIDENYATLYSCFIQKTFNLSQERLDKINKLRGTKFKLTT